MKKSIFTLLFVSLICFLYSQGYYYPPTGSDEWEMLDYTDLNWCAEKVDSMIDYAGENEVKSLLILKEGKMVLEHYFGTYTQDSIWYWASAAKSLVASLTGMAQEEGYLSIDDPTSDYLGVGWTGTTPENEIQVTIQHQLRMNTGLYDPNEAVGEIANCLDPECLQYKTDPGDSWAYFNSTYRLVQDVLVEATGVGKNIYTPTLLGNKIGMEGFWFGYLYFSRARDMARFGLWALSEGSWDGTQVMTDTDYFHDMVNTSQDLNLSYGYLWWLNGKESYMLPGGLPTVFPGPIFPDAPQDMYAALGANGQCIFVVPSLDMVVVVQSNAIDNSLIGNITFQNELWAKILDLECTTTATDDLAVVDIQISPNPAIDVIRLTANEPIALVRLLDLQGRTRLLKSDLGTSAELIIEQVPSGVYYLHLQTDHGAEVTRKLVKQE